MIFISINIYSYYEADEDMAWYSFCSTQEKCVSLAEPTLYNKFSSRVFLLNLLFVL